MTKDNSEDNKFIDDYFGTRCLCTLLKKMKLITKSEFDECIKLLYKSEFIQ